MKAATDSAGAPLCGWGARWRGDGEALLYLRETTSDSREVACHTLADREVTKVFPLTLPPDRGPLDLRVAHHGDDVALP
jgi:hypothetical protein